MMNEFNIDNAIQSYSPATQKIYRSIWNAWVNWCKRNGFAPVPVTQELFNAFLSDMRSQNGSPNYLRHFLPVVKLVNRHIGHDDKLTVGDVLRTMYVPPYILLNSAMMPKSGIYRLIEMSRDEWVQAVQLAVKKHPVQSYIGYPDTVNHVNAITGLQIDVNRAEVELGDAATLFIVKLKYRVSDPSQKGQFSPSESDYVYFIAQYTNAK